MRFKLVSVVNKVTHVVEMNLLGKPDGNYNSIHLLFLVQIPHNILTIISSPMMSANRDKIMTLILQAT